MSCGNHNYLTGSDEDKIRYRFALLKESMNISGQFLLIRLHLKTPSEKELIELKESADYIKKKIQETRQ